MTDSPRAQRRDAAENRAALLVAARLELNSDPDATLETIAARAGLSRRAVYGHFATRDDLVKELISSGAARIAASLADVHHPDSVVLLALIASRLWREVVDVRVMAMVAVRGPLQSLTAQALAPVRLLVRTALREGSDLGSVRRDIPIDTLARLVEDAALAGLAEATRSHLDPEASHRLVMLLVLSTAGLSAAAAGALIDSNPELAWTPRS